MANEPRMWDVVFKFDRVEVMLKALEMMPTGSWRKVATNKILVPVEMVGEVVMKLAAKGFLVGPVQISS